jgi:hypothetical protein
MAESQAGAGVATDAPAHLFNEVVFESTETHTLLLSQMDRMTETRRTAR